MFPIYKLLKSFDLACELYEVDMKKVWVLDVVANERRIVDTDHKAVCTAKQI